MIKSALRCTILIVGLSFAVASAQSPQTQIDAAKAAIQTARDALTRATAALNAIPSTTTTTPPPPTATGKTTAIAAGGDLQAALNSAACGDTLVLTAGAVYTGNFVLPSKPCTAASWITLKSSATWATTVTRAAPSMAAQMPAIKPAPGGSPALRTAPGASFYRLVTLQFLPLAGGVNDVLDLGDGSSAQATLAQVPHDLVVDRCLFLGDPTAGQKRAISLQSGTTTITGSYFGDIKAQGQDSQAIAGWNGPGPYVISNNYIEAASENLLFGGSDPAIPNLVPANITITGNYITKPVAWRNKGWNIKNLIELKSAMHVTVSGNVIEHTWAEAQSGFAIVWTVRNQDGNCPQCTVQDVRFTGNVVRHAAGAINILALDDNHGDAAHGPYTSVRASGLVFAGNLFYDIDYAQWGQNGRLVQIIDGPNGLTFDHNTIVGPGVNSLLTLQNGVFPIDKFIATNNVAAEGDYGIIGAGDLLGIGPTILAHYAPNYTWTDALMIVGGGNGGYPYPASTTVSPVGQPVLDATFHVLAPFATLTTTDSKPIGANIAALQSAISGLDLTK